MHRFVHRYNFLDPTFKRTKLLVEKIDIFIDSSLFKIEFPLK
jgi:hypothetical protein